jgi:hypothetical protein
MPKRRTVERARAARRAGKSVSTQAGEFVREQIREIRRGQHGARSPQQAIAIGLSEARRAGVNLPPPRRGKTKKSTRKSAEYAYEAGQGRRTPKRRPRVSRAVTRVLEKEPRSTVSRRALSRHAKAAAARRKRAGQVTPPAPSRKKKTAARRAPARKSAAKRPARARKSATNRTAAKKSETRLTGPSAAERAAARKAVEARKRRTR